MKKTELLMLADNLEQSASENFKWNFRHWCKKTGEFSIHSNFCQTEGCALGRAAILFPNDFELIFSPLFPLSSRARLGTILLRGTEISGLEAATLFFRISILEARNIFTEKGYSGLFSSQITPTMVAANIRKLVKYKENIIVR